MASTSVARRPIALRREPTIRRPGQKSMRPFQDFRMFARDTVRWEGLFASHKNNRAEKDKETRGETPSPREHGTTTRTTSEEKTGVRTIHIPFSSIVPTVFPTATHTHESLLHVPPLCLLLPPPPLCHPRLWALPLPAAPFPAVSHLASSRDILSCLRRCCLLISPDRLSCTIPPRDRQVRSGEGAL